MPAKVTCVVVRVILCGCSHVEIACLSTIRIAFIRQSHQTIRVHPHVGMGRLGLTPRGSETYVYVLGGWSRQRVIRVDTGDWVDDPVCQSLDSDVVCSFETQGLGV